MGLKSAIKRNSINKDKFIYENLHKLIVILPSCFCIQDNLDILEHVASARVFFDNKIYVECEDILSAERLCSQLATFNLRHNHIQKVKRLGPGLCAMMPKALSSRVLPVKKLHPSTTVEELFNIFPSAVDVAMRKTSAVAVFGSAAECLEARLAANKLPNEAWPRGQEAFLKPKHKCGKSEDIPVPSKYTEDFVLKPNVVEIYLKLHFSFETDISLIRFISSNAEGARVYFSRKFTAGFTDCSEARRVRIALEGSTMENEKISCILKFNESMKVKAPTGVKEKVKTEVESSAENLDSEMESEDDDDEEENSRLPSKTITSSIQSLDSDSESESEQDDEEEENNRSNAAGESDEGNESEEEAQLPPMKKKKTSHQSK